jgi:hypothetical protein
VGRRISTLLQGGECNCKNWPAGWSLQLQDGLVTAFAHRYIVGVGGAASRLLKNSHSTSHQERRIARPSVHARAARGMYLFGPRKLTEGVKVREIRGVFLVFSVHFCRFWSISTSFLAHFCRFDDFSESETRLTSETYPRLYYCPCPIRFLTGSPSATAVK